MGAAAAVVAEAATALPPPEAPTSEATEWGSVAEASELQPSASSGSGSGSGSESEAAPLRRGAAEASAEPQSAPSGATTVVDLSALD